MSNLTPKEIVQELDKHIVGQQLAKKSVAIALRNRWRRKEIEKELTELKDEIVPKNILMVGPTGVGKTEIARRLAKLANAPFIKVEATKFTEIGYVGRDVDSIIRDLVEISLKMIRETSRKEVQINATKNAQKKILKCLEKSEIIQPYQIQIESNIEATNETAEKEPEIIIDTQRLNEDFLKGLFDDVTIEIQLLESDSASSAFSAIDIPGMPGAQMGMLNVSEIFGKMLGGKSKNKKITVKEALRKTIEEETEKLLDRDKIIEMAINEVEQSGIVFIDEIDKICVRDSQHNGRGGEVSREGVQRDLLPLIEGTTVSTKYGSVKTDHILFITSGAFQIARPSDLLPELQGRLPIRVELTDLNQEDLVRILTEPKGCLLKQYTALMATEGVKLNFTDSGIKQLALSAFTINQQIENIGARRLHTILEKVLEEISYNSSDNKGTTQTIDENYVKTALKDITPDRDLSRFIL